MKRNGKIAVLIILVIFIAVFAAATAVSCVFYNSTDSGTYISAEYADVKKAEPVSGDMVNSVILICFSGETVSDVAYSFGARERGYFVGDCSLSDYYETISYGKIKITSLFPENGNNVFVYQASETRAHYSSISNLTSASKRRSEESSLLNSAIKAANEYFDYEGYNLDSNGDGYVDSVSFLVSGKDTSGSGWGGLLWPHSWDLAEISSLAGTTAASLNGITVNKYSFNFIQSVDVGYLCHETGHVFGMPDLYHYDADKQYQQVEEWDIMHRNEKIPQYPTVYLREKYLGVIGDNQIVDLSADGEYSLKPVTTATAEETVAYRIKINDKESIYFEYRSNAMDGYDSMLPGSGLIVYRVNGAAEGNMKGRYQSTAHPDEVYVYRPEISNSDTQNLSKAYLSCYNPVFSHLGKQTSSSNYDPETIFLTDGSNTGIIVKIVALNNEEVTFEVGLNGYGGDEVIDVTVDGDVEINYGEPLDIVVKVMVKGYPDYAIADPADYAIEYDSEKIGMQTATVIYRTHNGEQIKYNFTLTINDALTVDGFNLTSAPSKTNYVVGEKSVDLSGLTVAVNYVKAGAKEIKYLSSDADKWLVEGIDLSVSGEYLAKVTYLPFERSIYFNITVSSGIKSIYVSEKDSLTIVGTKESLRMNVIGVSEDGYERILSAEEYTVSAFDGKMVFVPQKLMIRCKSAPEISCERTICVVDESKLTEIKKEGTIKDAYSYGEELSLAGGVIKFVFGDKEFSAPAENYYSLYDEKYTSVRRGTQTLTVNHYGKENSYRVTVLASDSRILVSDGKAEVDLVSGYVLFDGEIALSEARKCFSSYLTVKFVKTEGTVRYELREGVHDGERLSSAVSIELRNSDGVTVMKLKIFIKGDADGDGRANYADSDKWAEALFTQNREAGIYLDMNGDGEYTLTDYILLCGKYGG